jgi:hypothetical protein
MEENSKGDRAMKKLMMTTPIKTMSQKRENTSTIMKKNHMMNLNKKLQKRKDMIIKKTDQTATVLLCRALRIQLLQAH